MIIFLAFILGSLLFRHSWCCKGKVTTMDQFKTFVSKYNKNYGPDEFQKRFVIFADKLKEIDKMNEESKGQTTYGINQYSDLSWNEFKSGILVDSLLPNDPSNLPGYNFTSPIRQTRRPQNFNWTNIMSPVKHQGYCGSCWAYATAAVAEAALNRITGRIYELSEQELLDCTNGTCDGSTIDVPFKFATKFGLTYARSYPYTGSKGSCMYNPRSTVAQLTGWTYFWNRTEDEMAEILATHGPLAVSMKVGRQFREYTGGILTSNDCANGGGHAVTVVGYGVENGQPYWISKNSWGTGWGESGYFRSARGVDWCGWRTGWIAATGIKKLL